VDKSSSSQGLVDDERLLQHARRAVATCPRLALLIEEFKAERR